METIQRNGLWHVTLAARDLVEQASLNKEDFKQDMGHFQYKQRKVIMSHIYDQHLVVSMEGEENNDLKQLMDGFSTIVGYKPFCKYLLKMGDEDRPFILPTYEWDRINPNGRYCELGKKSNIADLVNI